MPQPRLSPPRTTRRRHAFTLVELLIVMIIIALVVSIILPAIGGARRIARTAATTALMTDLLAAVATFEHDHGRLPGHFPPRLMGHSDNIDRGLSAMENVMLELAGGIVGVGPTMPSGVDALNDPVNPTNDSNLNVWVDPERIGLAQPDAPVYFLPDRKHYVAQTGGSGSASDQQVGQPPHTDAAGTPQLPDVTDAFGTPLLAWVEDDTGPQQIAAVTDFARVSSGDGGDRARFYWAANAAFLQSEFLGRLAENQVERSLIGSSGGSPGLGGADSLSKSLAGLLGHPSFPVDRDQSVNSILPAAARGSFIVHSAGPDGVFLSRLDRGAKQFSDGIVHYGRNFKNAAGNTYTDDQSRPETIDLLDLFDDLVVSGGS